MSETLELRPQTGFCELPEPDRPARSIRVKYTGERLSFADEQSPQARFVFKDDQIEYANRAVTVRSVETHGVVAAVLIVSGQDKRIKYRWDAFIRHAVAALTHQISLLIIDLFPPGPRDPQGIHKAIWDVFTNQSFQLPPDKPLTLAAYQVEPIKTAYVESIAVGEPLPPMPLFLEGETYVTVPLEETYQATWSVLPAELRKLVEEG